MIWYSVQEHDPDGESRYEISFLWQPYGDDFLIRECAEDYQHNHDGWEAEWPLTFVLWDQEEGGNKLGEYEVTREYEPVFYASKK